MHYVRRARKYLVPLLDDVLLWLPSFCFLLHLNAEKLILMQSFSSTKPYLARYDDLLDLETIESIKSSLEAEKDKMMAVYVERTGVESTILEVQMNKEAWFGGEVAKQLGFISDVLILTTAKGTGL